MNAGGFDARLKIHRDRRPASDTLLRPELIIYIGHHLIIYLFHIRPSVSRQETGRD